MKKSIHPEYKDMKVTCACGNAFVVRSNKEELHDHSIESLDDFFTEDNPEMNNDEGMEMTM